MLTSRLGASTGGVGCNRNPGLHVPVAGGTLGREAFPVPLLHCPVQCGLHAARSLRLPGAQSTRPRRAVATSSPLRPAVLRAEHRESDTVDATVRGVSFPDTRPRQRNHSRRLLRVPLPRL